MPEIKNIYDLDNGLSEEKIAELGARSLRGESACGFTEEQIEARKKEDYEFEIQRLREIYRAEQKVKKEAEEKAAKQLAKQQEREAARRAAYELKQANIAALNSQIAAKAKREADALCLKLISNILDLTNALSKLKSEDVAMLPSVRVMMENFLKL